MSKTRKVSRRQFLQTSGAVAGGVAISGVIADCLRAAAPPADTQAGFSVNIDANSDDLIASSTPGKWAINHLREALTAKGVALLPRADLTITLAQALKLTPPLILGPETLALVPSSTPAGQALHVQYSDPRGLAYALTELADRVRLSSDPRAALTLSAPIIEKPANPYRGMFRMFTSEFEDKAWFYDREGWQKYFDMLVTQRFNRFNLSFGLSYDFSNNLTDTYTFFMYPFFVNVPGHNVRAIAKGGQALAAEEQKKNLDTLKFISDQAAMRGLNFTLGIWTHNYRWNNSPDATYTIDGLDEQSQAPYSRDAMKLLINTCPGITGITLRTHGESGVPEGSYGTWKVIMSGITGHKNADGSDRIIELDLHGKTMTQEMIDTAATTGMPLIISCKQWAEHMGLPYVQASIRESEMPKGRDAAGLMALSSGTRSFLRYGIGDLMRKDRNYKVIHRVWPGTQHLLLWGDPLYAAGYGQMGSFAGMDGIDFFEPLSFKGRLGSSVNKPAEPDRTGYADASLRPQREWEKYLYTIRLWGRLSYNPAAKEDVWQRALQAEFGADGIMLGGNLAMASRILPLITTSHLPCAASALYWPEVYANQSLYDTSANPYTEVPNPKIFGNVSSLDPQIFASINEYADALLAGKPLAKVSPLNVADQLDLWNVAALNLTKLDAQLPANRSPAVRRLMIDALITTGLGQFFAHKFRAGVLWQLFNVSGHEPARAAAVDAYKKARDAWGKLADMAKVYRPNQPYGEVRQLRGHWADRLAAIDTDIVGMATRAPEPRTPRPPAATIDRLVEAIVHPVMVDLRKGVAAQHKIPPSFRPNQPLNLELTDARSAETVVVHYRHVHQGQRFVAVDAKKDGSTFTAAIEAEYTNSQFPLQYYFELRTANSAAMFPGFRENFMGTPYFVVLPA